MPAKRKRAIPEASPEAINENLGKRVKKLRGDRGWSLEELANVSGVSRSMLSEIEREKANPTLTVTFRIARAFGLTLQELIESAEASALVFLAAISVEKSCYGVPGELSMKWLNMSMSTPRKARLRPVMKSISVRW